MIILHLNTESGFRGGERQVLLLAQGLARRGHRQLVACLEGGELQARLAQEGIATAGFRKSRLMGIHSPMLRAWVRRVARDFGPEIVHAHTGNAHALAAGAIRGRLPLVVTRRVDFEVGARYRLPGQHYIAISNGVREVLERAGVARDRIDVVYSGIDTARVTGGDGATLRKAWLGDDAGPLVGFVGALVDHKAPWILAQAAAMVRARFPGARIVLVGDGEERARIESIRALHPHAIVLAGWRDDVADCYAAFDLFAMPSKLEGLCTSLVDALAARVPCVASAVGGIPDVVVDGETGVLVPPENPHALTDALASLWQDAPRRARFADAGQRRVAEHFTADAMVEGTERVYRKVLGLEK